MQVIDLHHVDYSDENCTKNRKTIGNNSLNDSSLIDASFRKVQKNSTAFLIWRIENLTAIAVGREQWGIFYDDDCYIIYSATFQPNSNNNNNGCQISGIETVHRPTNSSTASAANLLELHVHFWLGACATPERAGAAAYKAAELDNYLSNGGNLVTLHREAQNCESGRFKCYFKQGMRVLKSSSTSSQLPRLFRWQGRRYGCLTQLQPLSWQPHFTSNGLFLLQTKAFLLVWVGSMSSAAERQYAVKMANQLIVEHSSALQLAIIDDGYEQTLESEIKAELNLYLPLSQRCISVQGETGVERAVEGLRLYKCWEFGGKYRVQEVGQGPLQRTDLDGGNVFILDHAPFSPTTTTIPSIYVWVGRQATPTERQQALRNARGFVKKRMYCAGAQVTRVLEGAEPTEFIDLFKHWNNSVKRGNVQLLEEMGGVNKGWIVQNGGMMEASVANGVKSDECLVLPHVYGKDGEYCIIYCWLGKSSSLVDQSTAIAKMHQLDAEMGKGGVATLCKMAQGAEPPHFLHLFNGKFTVFQQSKNSDKIQNYLLKIDGNSTHNTKAVEMEKTAENLDSNFCFILQNWKPAKICYIWCGIWTNGDEKEMAKKFATNDFTLVMEGKETAEFWSAIGGKKQAKNTTKMVKNTNFSSFSGRLFSLNLPGNQYKIEEIMDFTQSDLSAEDVMLLDGKNTLFLYLGKYSWKTDREKRCSEMIEFYLKNDPQNRSISEIAEIHVKQGFEPNIFTSFFQKWNSDFWNNYQTFDQIRQQKTQFSNEANNQREYFDLHYKYPIGVLKSSTEKLPEFVDPLKRELHLTHDDFCTVFNMNFAEFESLPLWKQQDLKKQVGLF